MRAAKGGGPGRTAWDPMFVLRTVLGWRLRSSWPAVMCLVTLGCSFDSVPINSLTRSHPNEATGEPSADGTESEPAKPSKAKTNALQRDRNEPAKPQPDDGVET